MERRTPAAFANPNTQIAQNFHVAGTIDFGFKKGISLTSPSAPRSPLVMSGVHFKLLAGEPENVALEEAGLRNPNLLLAHPCRRVPPAPLLPRTRRRFGVGAFFSILFLLAIGVPTARAATHAEDKTALVAFASSTNVAGWTKKGTVSNPTSTTDGWIDCADPTSSDCTNSDSCDDGWFTQSSGSSPLCNTSNPKRVINL